jgi:hypothetical protein
MKSSASIRVRYHLIDADTKLWPGITVLATPLFTFKQFFIAM